MGSFRFPAGNLNEPIPPMVNTTTAALASPSTAVVVILWEFRWPT